jgi:hypothetical protein
MWLALLNRYANESSLMVLMDFAKNEKQLCK